MSNIDVTLQGARVSGSGIGYAGDDVFVTMHFESQVSPANCRDLCENAYHALWREGENPYLRPFKTFNPGLQVRDALVTVTIYPGAEPVALKGRVKAVIFFERDGIALCKIKFTMNADKHAFNVLLELKRNPIPELKVQGELQGGETQEELELTPETVEA